uniref:Nucleolar protein 6 n=1 Tax=Timema cristinae TaxID=61476 RepID=A0A7R9CYW9_TIMCR|nr:unnamed protein product [Timema cristinae]
MTEPSFKNSVLEGIPEGFFDIDESDQEDVNNASDSNDDETIKSESDIEDDPSLDNEERSGDVENTKKRPYDGGMEPVSKKKNKKNKQLDPKLYKPPTVKELNQLRETENLFNSNLFRLQLSDQGWLQSMNVKMPMKQQPFGGKGSFQFIKPSAVSIIGSFASKCCVGPDVCVDLAVEIPQQCFQQSDHLNERYLRKRALYLCHLAGTLHSCHLVQSASFRLCQGDPSRPVLEVRPAGKLGKRVVVALRPVPQSGVFKLARFSPEKNNVRPSWFFTTSDAIEEPYPPTPHHNHSTIQDLVSTANQEYCRLALEGHSNIKDGIRLLKVWLTQRKLNKGYGSFGGHIVAQLVSHLVIQKRISVLGSSYQVVRATWVYLAQSDWTNFGVSLAEPSRGTPPVSEFHQHFEVVLVDSTGYCNLCANMSKETYERNSSYEYETLIKHSKVRAHFQNSSYEYETLIKHSKVKPVDFEYGTGEEATLAVLSVFNELSKQVRELNDLPLEIISVQGTSPVFRYTDTFPPLAAQSRPGKKVTKDGPTCILLNDTSAIGMAPRWVPAIEAVIQLALSKKWPNDLEAVRRIKAAFHIEVAKCLSQQCGLTAQPYPNFVDVLKSGFVFRLRLAYPREVGLLKKHVTPHGVTTYVDTDESRDLEKDIVHIPTITGAVHGLHQEHPSYGPACCLSKRWLAAQMIDPHHFPEIVVELLVAWLYLCPEPHEPPTQPQTAFFRFLHLLASTNWVTQPVILNFNTELTREEVVEIESMFQSSRSTLPPLFLATSYQPSGVVWTKRNPTLQVLIRTAMLAKESLTIVEEKLFSRHFDTKVIFRPPLDVYDVLIYLRPLLNPRRLEAVDVNKDQPLVNLPPYQYQQGEKLPVVGFNPVQYYLQELRETYGEFALFFHDPYGGEVVGVSLDTCSLGGIGLQGECTDDLLVGKGPKIEPNIDTIVENFYILGTGLVRSVETNNSKLDAK